MTLRPLLPLLLIFMLFSGAARADEPVVLPDLLPITPENAREIEFLGYIDAPEVDSVVWSHNGLLAAAVDNRRGIMLYSKADPAAPHFLPLPMGYAEATVLFSPDDTRLLMTSVCCNINRSLIQLWDTATLQPVIFRKSPMGTMVKEPGFSPDSRYLIYTMTDFGDHEYLYLFDARSGDRLTRQVKPRATGFEHVVFSPDSAQMAVSLADGSVWLYDAAALKEVRSVREASPENPVRDLAFSPDGALLAMSVSDALYIIDLESSTQRVIPASLASTLTYNGDGTLLAFVQYLKPDSSQPSQSNLIVYDVTAGEIRNSQVGDAPLMFTDDGLIFSSNDALFVLHEAGTIDTVSKAQVYALPALDPRMTFFHDFGYDLETRASANTNRVAFHPFENILFTNRPPRVITLDAPMLLNQPVRVPSPQLPVSLVSVPFFTPDGRYILVGGSSNYYSGGYGAIDTEANGPDKMSSFVGDSDCCLNEDITMYRLAVSPDGQCMAVAGLTGAIRVYDLAAFLRGDMTGPIQVLDGYPFASIQFFPDGKLGVLKDNYISVLDVDTGDYLYGFPVGKDDYGFAVSPDGHRIATGSGIYQDGMLLIPTNQPYVAQVLFSPDASLVIMADDYQFVVHDAATGAFLFKSPQQWGMGIQDYLGVVMNHDGTLLVSAGSDGNIRLWGVRAK